jgi:hypothetical protein
VIGLWKRLTGALVFSPSDNERIKMESLAVLMGTGFLLTALLGIFFIILIYYWIKCIVDLINSEFYNSNNKIVWIAILLTVPPIGTILYLFLSDNQKSNNKNAINDRAKVIDGECKDNWKI